ncbi:MAG TPA: hypothetical protein VF975_10960 [Thermoanaerobaculia bacterium]
MFWNLFSNAVRFTPSGGSIDVGLFSTFTISIPVQATIPIETLERRARVSLGAPPLIASSLEKILLCVVAMPEQDGYSLIRRIRSQLVLDVAPPPSAAMAGGGAGPTATLQADEVARSGGGHHSSWAADGARDRPHGRV